MLGTPQRRFWGDIRTPWRTSTLVSILAAVLFLMLVFNWVNLFNVSKAHRDAEAQLEAAQAKVKSDNDRHVSSMKRLLGECDRKVAQGIQHAKASCEWKAGKAGKGKSVEVPALGPRARLAIGIPTVPRDNDYLSPVVNELVALLDAAPRGSPAKNTVIIIMNQRPGEHPVFDELRTKYGSRRDLVFIENNDGFKDPLAGTPDPDDFNNPDDKPGHKVRQQTCDVASLTKRCRGYGHYFMFMEDDFIPCENALEAIHYVLDKSDAILGDWSGVRVSYGMNGVLIPDRDLEKLSEFLMENVGLRPPDHLIIFWMARLHESSQRVIETGRINGAFRYNLLFHIGTVSSVRKTKSPAVPPQCWSEYGHVLWNQEKYQGDCAKGGYDLSPCKQASVAASGWTALGVADKNVRLEGRQVLLGDSVVVEQTNMRQESVYREFMMYKE